MPAEIILEYVKTLPETAGVYRMIDSSDKVLYVGKAKNLKSRVSFYTKIHQLNNRLLRMVHLTQKMEFIITKTESEAFLLEADLIKSLKPYFNILLRDDKTYPYIKIDTTHDYAMIHKYRGKKQKDGLYFGPFASVRQVESTIDSLQKIFLLRTCNDYIFAHRTRPCLLHQMKRCSAPCTGEISKQDYQEQITLAKRFLSGERKAVVKILTDKMYEHSEKMDFEQAALYRDRLQAIAKMGGNDIHALQEFDNADLVVCVQKENKTIIAVLFIRGGQNWGIHYYHPQAPLDAEISEVMDGFLGQFYQNKPCPDHIILSHAIAEPDILAGALKVRYDIQPRITVAVTETEKKALAFVQENLAHYAARYVAQAATHQKHFEQLADLLELTAPPKRIEVYDNAHISGSHPVGAMIVATQNGFENKEYRTWNIKDKNIAGDDYGMMREVFSRRFARYQEAITTQEGLDKLPDLLIIDGGQGQLSTVMAVMQEYGLDIPIVAVAKGADRHAGRERFFMPDKESFLLPETDALLYFIQRLRDEAHRHANGTHAKKRKMAIDKTSLDDIAGIGSARKKALIAKFGSSRAIAEASLAEIAQTPTISQKMAENIYAYFHPNG